MSCSSDFPYQRQYTLLSQAKHLKPTSVLRWALVESRIEIYLWDAVKEEELPRAPKFQSSKELREPKRYKPMPMAFQRRSCHRSQLGRCPRPAAHDQSLAVPLSLSLSFNPSLSLSCSLSLVRFFLVSFSFLYTGIVRIFTLFVFVSCKFN